MQYKSYKIRLEPNNKQATLFSQHCGVARHAYNVGLSYCNDLFKNETPHFAKLLLCVRAFFSNKFKLI